MRSSAAIRCLGMNLSALRPAASGQQDWVQSYLEQRINEALRRGRGFGRPRRVDEATLRGWLQEAETATADLRWSGDEWVAAALQPGTQSDAHQG